MSRRPVTIVAALFCAAALSACGTGLQAQTYQMPSVAEGATVELGGVRGIAVRNLHVQAPEEGTELTAGSGAVIVGGVVNNGTEDDALIGAFTSASDGAVLMLDGSPVEQIVVPAGQAAPEAWSMQLARLTSTVTVAQLIDVTLVFRNAGRVTLAVPVFVGDNDLENREEAQDPYGEGGH